MLFRSNRKAAREERHKRSARELGQDPTATSYGDLKHQVNCSSQALPHGIVLMGQKEVSSTDPTYQDNSGRDGVQVKIRDLERRIGDMAKNMGNKSTYDLASTDTESPFIGNIIGIVVSHKFKQPQMESYDGSGSSIDHIQAYRSRMALTTNLDELYYLAFPSTLKGPVNQWFHSLKPRSIDGFDQLSK